MQCAEYGKQRGQQDTGAAKDRSGVFTVVTAFFEQLAVFLSHDAAAQACVDPALPHLGDLLLELLGFTRAMRARS